MLFPLLLVAAVGLSVPPRTISFREAGRKRTVEPGWEGTEDTSWIQLAQDKVQEPAVMNTVMTRH